MSQEVSLHPPHLVDPEGQLLPAALIPFCAYKTSMMGKRRSDLDFIACDKFQPTLLDGQLCYSLNKSAFEKGETGTGERNGFFMIIDPGNHMEPTDEPNNFEESDPGLLQEVIDKYASIDLQQSSEESSSGRIYIDILSRFSSYEAGSFALTGLKKMTGTGPFISKIPEKVRNCQVESYVECRTRKYYEEWKSQCKCVPWSSSLTSSKEVRIKESEPCNSIGINYFLQEKYCGLSCVPDIDPDNECLGSCTGLTCFVVSTSQSLVHFNVGIGLTT